MPFRLQCSSTGLCELVYVISVCILSEGVEGRLCLLLVLGNYTLWQVRFVEHYHVVEAFAPN